MAADWRPREFLFSPDIPAAVGLAAQLSRRGAEGFPVSEKTMAFVSDLDAPPGLVVRADRPAPIPWSENALPLRAPSPLLVVLDRLQSPANVGALLRVAEAAGAAAALTTPGTADPMGPKALRASAGSAFRVPVLTAPSAEALSGLLAAKNIPRVYADAKGARTHWEWPWSAGAALWLGPERGLGGDVGADSVRIPMGGRVESLNVAVAAGVILMEAARQRGRA